VTRPWADPAAVAAAVGTLLPDLDAPAFARRQAAADRLAALGPPAVVALAGYDRKRWSAQQGLEVDLLVAQATPLQPEEARQLRSDPHFLVDCFYDPDPVIRAAAADRLAAVAATSPDRLAPVVAAARDADPDAVQKAVEDLRDAVLPKVK
jgi:hypothetical protein